MSTETITTIPRPRREFEVDLPIGYTDPEGATHRRVALRKMTGKEEAILADRRYQRNGGKLVSELLYSCIVRFGDLEPNGRGPVTRMYSADRNFLLLKLRSITFGPELEATYTCPSCGEMAHVTEDLDELPVKTLADGDGSEVALELEDGYVDRDGAVHTAMTLRLPTGADEEAVASQMRDNPSVGKNALLARCMRSLGDLPKPRLEALGPKIMSDLTMSDRRRIDRALEDAAPGVDLVREHECPGCGNTYTSSLDLSRFFVSGLSLEGLRREIFFLAYHLHWSWDELMSLDVAERRAYVELLTEQIERENAQIAQGGQ